MERRLIAILLTLAFALSMLPFSSAVTVGADEPTAIDEYAYARSLLYKGYSEQSRKYLADRIERWEAAFAAYNDLATDEEREAAFNEVKNAENMLEPMHDVELIPLNGFNGWTSDDLAAMNESSSAPVLDREHKPEGVEFSVSVRGDENGTVLSNGASRSGVAGQSPFGLDMSKADGLKLWLEPSDGDVFSFTIGLRSGVDNYTYTAADIVVWGSGYIYIPFEIFTTTGDSPLAKDGSMNYIRIESNGTSFSVADLNAYNEILESSAATSYSETQITSRNQIVNNAYYKIIEATGGKAITLGPPVPETAIRWGDNTLAIEDSSLKYSLEENREGDRTQMWQLSMSPSGNGTFRIINKSSTNVLTISESGTSIEAKEPNLNNTRQEWSISITGGKATIQVRNVGKLTVSGETVKATTGSTYKKFYLYKVVEEEYVQSWSDEFDGDSLDRTKWNVNDGYSDGAIYPDDDDLIDVSDGNMHFKGRYGRYDAYEMSGTYMNTSGKFAFGYGKIEIRAKLAYGTGQFPAFWLMPTDMMNMGAGEVDIMEMVVEDDIAKNGTVIGTVHWTDDEGKKDWAKVIYMNINGYGEKYLSDDYHTYGLEMDRDMIRYYFDGMQYNSLLYNSEGKKFAFGDTARYIVFNNTPRARTPKNDGWPSNIVDESWGAEKEYVIDVDYVRCFLEAGELTDGTEDYTTEESVNYSTGLNAVAVNDYWDINFPTDVKPDGTEIASADHMKKVYIMDPVTNVTKHVLSTGFDRALRVLYSPDGSKLAVASTQGNIAIFDTADYTKAPRRIYNGAVIQESVVFTKDSSALIVGGFNGGSQKYSSGTGKWKFRVFDADTGAKLQEIDVGSDPRFIAITDDGSKVAVTTTSNGTFVYNVSDWTEYAHLTDGHVRAIRGADFSSDGSLLATSDDNGVICLWDVGSKALIKKLNNVNTGSVRRLEFSPDDKNILCTSTYGAARLFDVESGELVSLLGGFGNVIREAAYSPNGKYIVVASYDGGAKVFASDGTYLETLKAGNTDANLEGYIVSRIKFTPDSSYVFFGERTYPHSLQKWALPKEYDKSALQAAVARLSPSSPYYNIASKVAYMKYATPHMIDRMMTATGPRPTVIYDFIRVSADGHEFSDTVTINRNGYVYLETVNSPYYEHPSVRVKNLDDDTEVIIPLDKDNLLSLEADANYLKLTRLIRVRITEGGNYRVQLIDEARGKSFASADFTVDGTKTATDEFMYSVNNDQVTITDCISGLRDVVIPDEIEGYPVTVIGQYAFAGYGRTVHHMTVRLPDTLTKIDQYAFQACSSLREIEFPSSLKTIGQYAFNDCKLLGAADIPDGTSVNTYAFRNTGVGTVTVGNGTSFSSTALNGNYRARELIVREGTTSVSANLGTQYLMESVYIPESVTSISGTLFGANRKIVKLYGVEGSYAQTFAENNSAKFEFVPLGAPVITGVEDGATYDLYTDQVHASWNCGHIAYLNGERRYGEADVTEPGEYELKVVNGYDEYSTTVRFTVVDTTPPPYTMGDLDEDGEITVADALAALRISVGLAEPQGYQLQAADIDGDGVITVSDALWILRKAAGLID